MSRSLPARPNLEHLRKQAKALLRDYFAGDATAAGVFGTREATDLPPRLADAQHAIAREYGFPSWPTLKQNVESLVSDDPALALAAAVRLNDAKRVAGVLQRFPSLHGALDGALPNDAFGATPLIAAATHHNHEMVRLLLDAGANVNQRTHWWAGGFGILGDDAELNAYLISRGAIVDAHAAARSGMIDRLRAIVTADPEAVHARFGDGQTPLHVAASVEIAELLLEHGADIDALDVDHESTPAQYLVGDHPDVVRYLISRGCRTDILMASAVGDVDRVREILDADRDAIWTVVSPRCFPMKDPRAGGTIYIWSLGKFKSAYSVARERGYEQIVELVSGYAPASLAFAQACEVGDEIAIVRLRVERGEIDVAIEPRLVVRLVQAAEVNNIDAVRMMLANGWPATAQNESGATALHWAAFHGNGELVGELIRRGADANARENSFNATPKGWMEYGADRSWHRAAGDYGKVLEALSAVGAE